LGFYEKTLPGDSPPTRLFPDHWTEKKRKRRKSFGTYSLFFEGDGPIEPAAASQLAVRVRPLHKGQQQASRQAGKQALQHSRIIMERCVTDPNDKLAAAGI